MQGPDVVDDKYGDNGGGGPTQKDAVIVPGGGYFPEGGDGVEGKAAESEPRGHGDGENGAPAEEEIVGVGE